MIRASFKLTNGTEVELFHTGESKPVPALRIITKRNYGQALGSNARGPELSRVRPREPLMITGGFRGLSMALGGSFGVSAGPRAWANVIGESPTCERSGL